VFDCKLVLITVTESFKNCACQAREAARARDGAKTKQVKMIFILILMLIQSIISMSVAEKLVKMQRVLRADPVKQTNDLQRLIFETKSMLNHTFSNYLTHAIGFDELKPVSCVGNVTRGISRTHATKNSPLRALGHNTWSNASLTIIDSLDTLIVMGERSTFRDQIAYLCATLSFDRDIQVSVFETNIRVLGGLLSAYLLSKEDKTLGECTGL
jgi:hypothetical protein